jgi:hypothetical protein
VPTVSAAVDLVANTVGPQNLSPSEILATVQDCITTNNGTEHEALQAVLAMVAERDIDDARSATGRAWARRNLSTVPGLIRDFIDS